jgi:hypothetical protein
MKLASIALVVLLGSALPTFADAQVDVSFNVVAIAQPSRMSCWATAATMLVNWKSGKQRTIAEVVTGAGTKFVALYNASLNNPTQGGINPADEAEFYRNLKLSVIQSSNPTVRDWGDLMKRQGPLSVTVTRKNNFVHALVVIGLVGNDSLATISYIDPDGGLKRDVTFGAFLKLYEGAAKWPLQIIYNP